MANARSSAELPLPAGDRRDQQAAFSEVTIGDTTTDAIDYREGNEPTHVRKLSGLTKYGNVTLKWGITDSMDLPTGTMTSSRRNKMPADARRWSSW